MVYTKTNEYKSVKTNFLYEYFFCDSIWNRCTQMINGRPLRLSQINSVFPVIGWLGFRQIFEEKKNIFVNV